jgi:hypothetical protein
VQEEYHGFRDRGAWLMLLVPGLLNYGMLRADKVRAVGEQYSMTPALLTGARPWPRPQTRAWQAAGPGSVLPGPGPGGGAAQVAAARQPVWASRHARLWLAPARMRPPPLLRPAEPPARPRPCSGRASLGMRGSDGSDGQHALSCCLAADSPPPLPAACRLPSAARNLSAPGRGLRAQASSATWRGWPTSTWRRRCGRVCWS